MKTISTILMATVLAAGNYTSLAQPSDAATPPPEKPAATDAKPAEAATPAPGATDQTDQTAAPVANGGATGGIRLDFKDAPLEQVLKYLSDAAGFHIVLEAPVRGNVTVISSHPMSKDEAVMLLNSVLNKSGLAAIRNEQFLTIVDRNEAKTREIPVNVYNDNPNSIPKTAEIVTQIIPIRFVEARQLASDLSPFVSPQATIVANEAGNSILITDTQANIRHLAEIIKAVDSSAEASTEIRVFHLNHANPTDVATLLSGVFPSQTSGSSQTPARFGRGGGGRGGGGGGGGGGGPGGFFAALQAANAGGAAGAAGDRIRKQMQVVAVADLRTSSVVVTAQKDLMEQIATMIEQLDVTSTRDQKVYVYRLDHGDPKQVLQVLQGAFPSGSTTSSRGGTSSSQTSALQAREAQNANTMGNASSQSSSALGGNRSSGGGRPGN